MEEQVVAVIGLGYVGLMVANAAQNYYKVIGFDTSSQRISQLKLCEDVYEQYDFNRLEKQNITFSDDENSLKKASIYVIAAPTPLNIDKKPDLSSLIEACKTVGKYLSNNDLVIIESTVYPGACDEICYPILIKDLKHGQSIYFGYSPERINPSDTEHTFENTNKIVSGIDNKSLCHVKAFYRRLLSGEITETKSIKIAEAAKLVENIQRDINIALMNELAQVFHVLNINTRDVLKAANSKWNFLGFMPGLVGGHCIPIDPIYLISRAKKMGKITDLLNISRSINNTLPEFIVKVIDEKLKNKQNKKNILVLGISYKANCSDMRNSLVPDLVSMLEDLGCNVVCHDPVINKHWITHDSKIQLLDTAESISFLDAAILAVGHQQFTVDYLKSFFHKCNDRATLFDLTGKLNSDSFANFDFWQL